MKHAQSAKAGCKPRQSKWNHPPVRVRWVEANYVFLFNALVTSFFGPNALKLGQLSELGAVVRTYASIASWARDSGDIALYYRANQVACFFKKLELPLFEQAATSVALAKWQAAEASCREMNRVLWHMKCHPLTHEHGELDHAITLVRAEIESLLGPIPPDLDEVAVGLRFGPGASLSHPHNKGAAVHKLLNSSALLGMEDELTWLIENTAMGELLLSRTLTEGFEELSELSPQVEWHERARLAFVPKSIEEMRSIEIGPSLATLFQQAYDGFIRRRLQNGWGVDLRKQEPNQFLAYQGSVAGPRGNSPCTIDLSAASDRISFGVFASVLPPSWVRTLSRYRAKIMVLPDGTTQKLEKYASMGNSLTFSLQTLIFAAVVRSVLRERGHEGSRWRVYGDDIIVPYRIYDDVVSRLEILGFRINEDKSHSSGFFRESCGADYLHGTNVRPLYIKQPIRTVADLYKYCNLVQAVASRAPIPAAEYEAVYTMLLSAVPKNLRIYGDTWRGLDSCIWSSLVDDGIVLRRRQVRKAVPDKLAYLARLFLGYRPVGLETRIDGRRVSCGGSMLSRIDAHQAPAYESAGDFVLRRSHPGGLVVRLLPREQLPFEPLLRD